MPLVRLVSWNRDEATERGRLIEKSGFTVNASPLSTSSLIRGIRDLAPAAVLIDMDRLPAHGRAVATLVRRSASTCLIPIVFAGGAPDKVKRARQDFPDAAFTDWKTAGRALKKAIENPPVNPVRPEPFVAQYAATSLSKKLGFKPGLKASLLGAPDGFDEQVGDLPEGVALRERMTPDTQLALWFVRSRLELESETAFLSARLPQGASLWIIFPKQTSRFKSDFNTFDVRAVALAAGLVDYKICAVDADWSGMKFARKRDPKTKTSSRTGLAAGPARKRAGRK
jgi:hypothetical protein